MLYKGADIFVICVGADRSDSLANVQKWLDEIKSVERTKPIMLMLCKKDIQDPAVTFKNLKAKREQFSNTFIGTV